MPPNFLLQKESPWSNFPKCSQNYPVTIHRPVVPIPVPEMATQILIPTIRF